ncbi:His Kinase A (phospho-acceptor) domain-containing protein [Abditibacterium utsteinense]|uniref:histidine kinase n=1 Tax=Abditibacterium utsteinense TaxID=1960156 RepID=A0A2S8SPF4_9BACT|nr:response regulator [Abditibacterium utsteinense]PQV62671.1 His Kinase A (phospho-acceptor) domain-containing protein [Abditibacterium utsteinense]
MSEPQFTPDEASQQPLSQQPLSQQPLSQQPLSQQPLSQQPLSAEFLHDLLTPLNQIIGYSEMLSEQAQQEGQTGFVPDLQRIHTAGWNLLTLLNSGAPLAPRNSEILTAVTPDTALVGGTDGQLTLSSSQGLLLVADDNEANRDVLSRRLERQGYDVIMAVNGRDALAAMRAQAFDLVLLDIMMPEMDGFEALQRIKSDEALRQIPVIMISALHEVESVVRCIEMGAEDYLCKPFDPTLLKARIGTCLEKKRAHDRETRLFEQLQQNYKRLQELEKLRDDLTHMIVHDLRTPLNSVMVGMQTVSMIGELNAMQREVVDIALGGGETLLNIINEMLDVDKMESGNLQLDYAALSAADLIASAISQVASLATSKKLTLIQQTATDLPLLRGDENKLRRTLVNLIGNAIKFTPPGGVVTIEAHPSEKNTSMVFSVSDTGEGIPAEAFGRIFDKFGQVKSKGNGRTPSTGLGLTFCRLVVEAHGGHLEVESRGSDQGSTFRFTVPLSSG